MAEIDEIGVVNSGNCKDETVRRLPSKNSNKTIGYLIPNAR